MPLGSKQVYLPNFTIALLRTSHLPPNYAQFLVPLNINKLDLKDYLLHVYGVEVLSVRSYIQQQKILNARPSQRAQIYKNWYRPRAIKRMTVELVKPFVYPEPPKDFSEWDKEFYTAAGKEQEESRKYMGDSKKFLPSLDRPRLREMAEKLMTGKLPAKQKTETIEVEKDISV